MLKILKRIVQDVTAASDLKEALGILVQRIIQPLMQRLFPFILLIIKMLNTY